MLGIVAVALMFTAWAWGFFNIRIEPKLRKKILMMIGVLVFTIRCLCP